VGRGTVEQMQRKQPVTQPRRFPVCVRQFSGVYCSNHAAVAQGDGLCHVTRVRSETLRLFHLCALPLDCHERACPRAVSLSPSLSPRPRPLVAVVAPLLSHLQRNLQLGIGVFLEVLRVFELFEELCFLRLEACNFLLVPPGCTRV